MADRNFKFQANPDTRKDEEVWIWTVLDLQGTKMGAAYWSRNHWTGQHKRWAVYGEQDVETDAFRTRDDVARYLIGTPVAIPEAKPEAEPIKVEQTGPNTVKTTHPRRVTVKGQPRVKGAPANLVAKGSSKPAGELAGQAAPKARRSRKATPTAA